MSYLFISDIHANLEALDAVLADAGSYDVCVCLGDLVGYGPNPNECVERVLAQPNLVCLVGNHDLAALGSIDAKLFNGVARTAIDWTASVLSTDAREALVALTPSTTFEGLTLAHGSPRDPVWEYIEAEYQAPPNFRLFDTEVCFVGHTHVPRVFTEDKTQTFGTDVVLAREGDTFNLADGKRRIVNPGGVGQPRDGDPRAAYAMYDPETGTFAFHRVEYPVEVTQAKISRAGLPGVLASRLPLGF